jgi:hypothetical protein
MAVAAQAAERVVVTDFASGVDARGVPKGWELKEKVGRADFRIIEAEGSYTVHLRSTNTSFCLQRGIKADLKQTPFLSWKWKVTRLPSGGDFRRSKTDDQAAQLFVAFSRTEAIVYLWDTSAPEGLMADAPSPPFTSIKAVVVRSKAKRLGEWITETRNVYEDYTKFFGKTKKTPVVSGMRLQINTQHTQSTAECFFADVVFQPESSEKKLGETGNSKPTQ